MSLTEEDATLLAPVAEWLDMEAASLSVDYSKSAGDDIRIYIKCIVPDPADPRRMKSIVRSHFCKSTATVASIVEAFQKDEPSVPGGKQYYLGYDQILFREGTLAECGITHDRLVELYAPGKNATAYHNEGLSFVLGSVIPLVIGLACLVFSVTSTTDVEGAHEYSGMFLFVGFLLCIPSVLILILGFILMPDCPMPCYFTGTEWC
jgi:hypothetical protein